jgi:hypothetical protein
VQLVTSDRGRLPSLGAGRLDIAGGTQVGILKSHNSDLFFIADLDSWVRDPRALPSESAGPVCSQPGKLLLVADPTTAADGGREIGLTPVRVVIARMVDALPRLVRSTDPQVVGAELEEAFAAGRDARPGLAMSVAYVRWPMLYAIGCEGGRGFALRGDRVVALPGDSTAHRLRVRAGDDVLLCSDGLTSCVTEDAIAQQACAADTAAEVCQGLIRIARRAGGRDDTTVVVARC